MKFIFSGIVIAILLSISVHAGGEPEVYQDQRKAVFVVSQEKFKLTTEGISCNDSMSEENFEASVLIELDGKELKGCGRALY